MVRMESLLDLFLKVNQLSAEQMKALASDNIPLSMALCFLAGILASFTPCVYPVIPITLSIFGRASSNQTSRRFNPKTFKLALIYVLGMSSTYCLLGLVSGLSGSLFGGALQNPILLLFLTLLFLGLALAQWGAFQMNLPSAWRNRLAQLGNSESKKGIYLMGVVSGLIVSPCVGPVIAGILAFVFETSEAFLGALYFFSFSLGLGVLFLLVGGFSGLLAILPRSGPWMQRVNHLLAALMLIASAYFGILFLKSSGIWRGAQAPNSNAIVWLSDESQALTLSKNTGKPLLIDFTAEWCAACHELDEQVFQAPEVSAAVNTHFVPLRIDVTADTEGNAALLERYAVSSLPSIVFTEAGTGIPLASPRVHGLVTPQQFLHLLKALVP